VEIGMHKNEHPAKEKADEGRVGDGKTGGGDAVGW